MQRIDALIVGALVLAAAASAAGVLTYDDSRVASFRVTWTTSIVDLEVPSTSVAGAGDAEQGFAIATRNGTLLDVEVTITSGPARLQPTAYRLELVGPGENVASAEGELPLGPASPTVVPLQVELAPVPDATSARGSSPDAARAALDAAYGSDAGTGNWTLRASFAPGAPGLGGSEPNAFSARVTLTAYAANLSADIPEVGR